MIICIEGKVRRRTRVGSGIFRVEKWHMTPFKLTILPEPISSGESLEAGEHITFRCEQQSERVFIRSEVNRKPFVLGEADFGESKMFRFSILSVAGYEVTGTVSCKD